MSLRYLEEGMEWLGLSCQGKQNESQDYYST